MAKNLTQRAQRYKEHKGEEGVFL